MRLQSYPPTAGDYFNSSLRGVHYEVISQLGCGGKGVTFLAKQYGGEQTGQTRVVKVPRLDVSQFSLSEIESRLREGQRELSNEMKASQELKQDDGVAPILDVGGQPWQLQIQKDGRTEPIQLFHTVYPFIEGRDLGPSRNGQEGASWCEKFAAERGDAFQGITDVAQWFCLARQLFEILDRVHYQRVVHGDIWPPNIRMTPQGKPVLIDFGQAWSLEQVFGRRSDMAKSHAYLAPERYFVSERKTRWYASADIYSMGGVLFYLATGQEPPSPWESKPDGRLKSNRTLKHEVAEIIKNANIDLFRSNIGVIDIIMSCLCPNIDYRAKHASVVLETIEAFEDSPTTNSDRSHAIKAEFERIRDKLKALSNLEPARNPVVQKVVLRRLRALREDLAPLEKRVFSVVGDREAHVNGLLDCISTLGAGDELFAVTSTLFWRKGNFGPYGRLSAMLSQVALRGATIRWVVLAIPDDPQDSNILEYIQRVVLDYEACIQCETVSTHSGSLEIRCNFTTEAKIDEVRRERNTGILLRKGESWTLIAPDYSNEGKVSVVRIWSDPIRRDELVQAYEKQSKNTILIKDLVFSS